MYWDELKEAFLNVSELRDKDDSQLCEIAERIRERLYEMLDDEGCVLLEKYLYCLELLSGFEPNNKKGAGYRF